VRSVSGSGPAVTPEAPLCIRVAAREERYGRHEVEVPALSDGTGGERHNGETSRALSLL